MGASYLHMPWVGRMNYKICCTLQHSYAGNAMVNQRPDVKLRDNQLCELQHKKTGNLKQKMRLEHGHKKKNEISRSSKNKIRDEA